MLGTILIAWLLIAVVLGVLWSISVRSMIRAQKKRQKEEEK